MYFLMNLIIEKVNFVNKFNLYLSHSWYNSQLGYLLNVITKTRENPPLSPTLSLLLPACGTNKILPSWVYNKKYKKITNGQILEKRESFGLISSNFSNLAIFYQRTIRTRELKLGAIY